MKKNILFFLISITLCAYGQANTAFYSGSIGKCEVWDFPYTLYNNAGASQTVNDGITVTVDQNRNIGAVNLSGTGGMDFNGANGITMSGSGGEINCRWDINRSDSHTMTNNDNNPDPLTYFQNWGTFFTAPYAGSYVWIRRSGWSASVSGGVKNAGIRVIKNNNKSTSYSIFFQNESGTCAASGAIEPAGWEDYTAFAMNPGDTFQYGSSTRFSTGSSCSPTTLNATVGNAVLLYDN